MKVMQRINMKQYFIHDKSINLSFKRPNGSNGHIKTKIFIDALVEFNRIIQIFEEVEIPIGDILGLRNLSAFVGEVYNRAVKKIAGDLLENNPHQDGYPDLLIMDEIGRKAWNMLSSQLHEKEPFSSFSTGGIEVKATCGDLKSGKWFTANNIQKPIIGEKRLEWVTGYNWKAHHRETNNLIGLIWDFVETNKGVLFKKHNQVAVLYVSKYVKTARANSITIFDRKDFLD